MPACQPVARPPAGGGIALDVEPATRKEPRESSSSSSTSRPPPARRGPRRAWHLRTSWSSRRAPSGSALRRRGLSTLPRRRPDDPVSPAPELVSEQPAGSGRAWFRWRPRQRRRGRRRYAGACSITNRPFGYVDLEGRVVEVAAISTAEPSRRPLRRPSRSRARTDYLRPAAASRGRSRRPLAAACTSAHRDPRRARSRKLVDRLFETAWTGLEAAHVPGFRDPPERLRAQRLRRSSRGSNSSPPPPWPA